MMSSETAMTEWCGLLQAQLDQGQMPVPVVGVHFDSEHQIYLPAVEIQVRGLTETLTLGRNFFQGSEYQTILAVADRTKDLLGENATVSRGEKQQAVTTFGEAHAWLMGEARRGVDIQRYKGLGEMNPDQLWQTTMDPEVRRMLRVTVDDAVAADQMFTTLMGDQVEPRREFIQSNALSVVNLDV
jgi:DNA gyrase subunit B